MKKFLCLIILDTCMRFCLFTIFILDKVNFDCEDKAFGF